MSARIPTIVGIVVLFFFFPFSVCASDVVINEFQVEPSNIQWVELYNKGSDSQDISGWVIDDNGSPNSKYSISSNTQLPAGACLVFSSGNFNFNIASSDSAQLISGTTIIDQYAYTESPGNNISFGRSPDGTGGWTTFMSPNQGSLNSTGDPCLPAATPTPTPTSAPTPAPTSTPTNTPVPTNTPTPTVSNAASPTKIPTSTPVVTPTVEIIPTIVPSPTGMVLGDRDGKTQNNKPYIIALLFVSVGCALLAAVFVIKNRLKISR